MTADTKPALTVDIWSDVVCPWCYIGKARFDAAISAIDGEIDITVNYHAYQLDPTASPGKTEPVRGVYERKFGGPEAAERILGHVTSIAAESGITFNMDIAQRSNTMLAHRLIEWASREDTPSTQADVKHALLAAYFTDGKNVGDPDDLAEVLEPLGFARHETLAFLDSSDATEDVANDLNTAAQLGITAVPTYVINGQWSIPGAQDAETFERALRRLAERTQQQ